MRPAQAVMADLASSGLSPAQLALVIELSATVAAEARPVEDKASQRRRERDREYQAERRHNRQISADSDDIAATPFLDKEAPQTPKEINPSPVCESHARGPFPKPVWADDQHWADFLTNRKRKRLSNTASAYNRFLTDMNRVSAETGIPPPELLRIAAENGWASINEPDDRGTSNGTANRGNNQRMGGPRPDPTLALVRAATAAQRQDAGDYRQARPPLPSGQYG